MSTHYIPGINTKMNDTDRVLAFMQLTVELTEQQQTSIYTEK